MGNLYEAIKDYMKDCDKCNECIELNFDFQLEEFNGVCEECIEPTFDFQLEEFIEYIK